MKGKKLLAGVLSAAMVLGTMALPAFADDEATELPVADENGVITLTEDVTLKGSFNISNNLDLGGHILTIDNVTSVIKNGTIKNGTIKVAQNANSLETMLRIGDYSHASLEVEMKNVTIDAQEDYTALCGLLGIYQESKLTLNHVTINVGSNDGVAVIYGNDQKADLIANDINITAVNQNKLIYGVKDADIKNMTFKGKVNKELFSVVGGKVKDSTFTYTNAENEVSRSITSDAGLEKELTFINTKIENAPTFTKNAINNTGINSKVVADDLSTVNGDKMVDIADAKLAVAQIGDKYYTTLKDAVAAAQDGDTITLYSDVTLDSNTTDVEAATINLNNHTITADLSGMGVHNFNKGMTFKGGNIHFSGSETTWSRAVIDLDGNAVLEFDDVNIVASECGGLYLMDTHENGTIVLKNGTTLTSNNSNFVALIVANNTGSNKIVIDNSTVTGKNIKSHVIFGNCAVVNIENGSVINVEDVGAGIFMNEGSLTISDDSTVTIKDIKATSADWNKTGAGIVLGANTSYTVAETATVNATVYRPATEDNLTDTINVTLEDVTQNDGEKVYDIYLNASDDKTINRLTSAEFTFALTTSDDINYEVSGADNVTVTPDNAVVGKYGFNFDGVTVADKTGAKIKLGQIKFTGYGKFDFAIDGTAANAVHATELEDNIVTDFIANPDSTKANEGQLTTDNAKLTDIEISKPLQKLTINIDFPNAVTDNANEYQKMFVEISGGDEGKIEYKLGNGTDEYAMNEGKYVITADLTKNTTYTVTVKGEGYRTARYTVNMTGDKVLNFWNNVKTDAINVEEGVTTDATKKNVTFLAGDIVKDGKINIYDLSAVVSYFGTNNLVSEHKDYAKYDLNRDGKIDSKDVAYVLVSWGK